MKWFVWITPDEAVRSIHRCASPKMWGLVSGLVTEETCVGVYKWNLHTLSSSARCTRFCLTLDYTRNHSCEGRLYTRMENALMFPIFAGKKKQNKFEAFVYWTQLHGWMQRFLQRRSLVLMSWAFCSKCLDLRHPTKLRCSCKGRALVQISERKKRWKRTVRNHDIAFWLTELVCSLDLVSILKLFSLRRNCSFIVFQYRQIDFGLWLTWNFWKSESAYCHKKQTEVNVTTCAAFLAHQDHYHGCPESRYWRCPSFQMGKKK